MSKLSFLVAVTFAVVAAFVFSGSAGAQGEASWSCHASAARIAFPPGTIPAIDPINATPNLFECADDAGGPPNISIPPPPDDFLLSTDTAYARTDVLCRTAPAPPTDLDQPTAFEPTDNDACDAGTHSINQQVIARAGVEHLQVSLPPGEGEGLDIRVEGARSGVRGSCVGDSVNFQSDSRVVGVTINGQTLEIPDQGATQEISLGPLATVILNQRVGPADGVQPANSANGLLIRRAVRVIAFPGSGSEIFVDVGESIADYHGLACQEPRSQTQCPPGTVPSGGVCVIEKTACPPGSVLQNGQCVATRVQCPQGTTFDPSNGNCIPSPRGGRLVPKNQVPGHLRSPCRNPRYGGGFAILGTNRGDRITGTNLSDAIFALAGSDRVSGGRGNDCVEGDSGNDVIDGSNGNDLMLGGRGRDRVLGGPGTDRLLGQSGRDRLDGGINNDRVNGGSGGDKIRGGDGNDLLVGGSGNDGINTGNGKDRVFGGSGNDIINAGARGPAAFVNCGSGRDRVRINNNERGRIRSCEFVDVFHRIRRG